MTQEELYRQGLKESLYMLEAGKNQQDILAFLTHVAEKAAGPDTVSSILLLDKSGLLRNGASPQLPLDYINAIDGIRPDPNVGTCAAAAATSQVIITEDFTADNKWAELKHLPIALGFIGAWSLPIKTIEGKVLGTFGTYFREKRIPTANEIRGVEVLANAVAMVLNRSQN
ncbi:MAG TPA: GAF domain-containing protein [Flavobacteriales bacterium]|nr:GAF domain-containing protein [Flavobacteriales bacterium]